MFDYVLWEEVQNQLTEHFRISGDTYSFIDALSELFRSGRYYSASELPKVTFSDWEINAASDLIDRVGKTPIDMSILEHDTSAGSSPLNIRPICIAADQKIGIHTQDTFEMNIILKGSARLICSGESRTLKEKQICLLSCNFPHDFIADKGSVIVSLAIVQESVEAVLGNLLSENDFMKDFFAAGYGNKKWGYLMFSIHETEKVYPILRSIFEEYYNTDRYSKIACISHIGLLFIQLLRMDAISECCEQDTKTGRSKFPILPVLQYIQHNYRTASLAQTADHFNFDCSYMGKQIKAYTGRNFTEIITGLKIEKVRELLSGTDFGLEEIASLSGFNSAGHCSRSFLAETGMRPREYRRSV